MRLRRAISYALKYHALALIPTLLGVTVVVAAVWFGVGRHLAALQNGGGSLLSAATFQSLLNAVDLPLALAGVVLGYYVRRVGRTALLVRTQCQALTGVGTANAGAAPRSANADGSAANTAAADTRPSGSADDDAADADGGATTGANADGNGSEYDDLGFQRD